MKISYLINTSDDLKVISRWYFDEWGHLNPSNSEEKIYERLSSKFDKEDEFLCFVVIHEKELLVAVADLKYREHKDYPEYEHWIGGVYVKPECRGKGYASALVEKAKEHVVNLSISELYLQCEDHNEELYLKHGFKPLHTAIHSGVKTRILKFKSNPQ